MKDVKTLIKISNCKASSVNGSPKPQNFPEDSFAAVTYLNRADEASVLEWCLALREELLVPVAGAGISVPVTRGQRSRSQHRTGSPGPADAADANSHKDLRVFLHKSHAQALT